MTNLRDESWTNELWQSWREKLEHCSLEQLQKIATQVKITFTGGNGTVDDPDTLILALDEISPEELEKAYNLIVASEKK